MAKAKKSNKVSTTTLKNKPTNAKPTEEKKSNNNNKKKNNQSKKRSYQETQDQYEDLGQMDTWDWNEVNPTSFMGDETTGFLCLEEISDVEIDYEGDDKIGKIMKFKRKKNDKRQPGKKACPTQPMEEAEMNDFYDLDTFTEEGFLAQQKQQNNNNSNDGDDVLDDHDDGNSKIQSGEIEIDNVMDVDHEEEDSSDNNDNDEKSIPLKQKDQKKNKKEDDKEEKDDKKKPLSKKEKQLEKLKAQMKKLEESIEEEKQQESKKKEENKKKEEKKDSKPQDKKPTLEDIDQSVDVTAWKSLKLSDSIVNALKYYKFCEPTPIQQKTLPKAMEGRDIIGVAETGSGKTLAFGIPIVDYILRQKERASTLTGLILAPTRELAIQVKDHIQNISIFGDVKVAAIVGGMSIQKQERQLKYVPDIIVATPGRLWEILSTFLVLDEADRMLEKGHFQELSNILDELSSRKENTTEWPEEATEEEKKVIKRNIGKHQTFIFTATLDKNIRFNVKSKRKPKKSQGSITDLVERIEFSDENPVLVNMTSEKKVASRLVEAKVDCLKTEKDLYVYYFVTRYPGRTILFVNSIDAIRRLVPVFKLLNVEVLGLHAQMQQKQRLKNLDRFKANDRAVLVASDVAARGLDIPLVEHVIHYQLPRSGEIYVHRSGRTARANRDGISLLLCGPDEMKVYYKLCQTLRKGEKYPDFPIDTSILREMKKRVELATEIDKIEHQENKTTHEDNWMRNMAKEMDIELDEDMFKGNNSKKQKEGHLERERAKAKSLRFELKNLLKTPILPDGASTRYLTGTAISGLVDRMIANEDQQTLLPAHSSSKAVDDVKLAKKRKLQK
ncbi:P-loop containing nucleoside triphosphate hydrolase protein [Cunninghamella echinulata]|nr:P-loop containing nucleoside triphosphate hydrolase protein [Cunninghamella echinulata]